MYIYNYLNLHHKNINFHLFLLKYYDLGYKKCKNILKVVETYNYEYFITLKKCDHICLATLNQNLWFRHCLWCIEMRPMDRPSIYLQGARGAGDNELEWDKVKRKYEVDNPGESSNPNGASC
jgi:hypothetical protein